MKIWVDEAKYKFGRMLMCHMISDDIQFLHSFAAQLGIKSKWFQNTKYPHYDICKSKRKLAVELGAIEISTKDLIKICKNVNTPANS